MHTIAITIEGALWAWGQNEYGQLGDGNRTQNGSLTTPTRISPDTNWMAVSAGFQHTLALKADGALWAWGYNGWHQLGDGTRIGSYAPMRIGTSNDWKRVVAGNDFSVVSKQDGSLWAWGRNTSGQLGTGSLDGAPIEPAQIGTNTDWAAFSAGWDQTLALKMDGSLWAWGYNAQGQLGIGSFGGDMRIGTANDWMLIAAGGDANAFTLAIKRDGSLWAWGFNSQSQLGDGSTATRLSPVRVGTANNWSSLATGNHHTVGLRTDGTLWTWGGNWSGELGYGSIPLRIGTDTDWGPPP